MSTFSRRGIKTLLLLSCSSVLATTLEAPLIYAAESFNIESQSSEVKEEDGEAVDTSKSSLFNFTKIEEEASGIELFPLESPDSLLQGKTFPNVNIRIIFSDETEIFSFSNEEGFFSFSDFIVTEGAEFQVLVENEAEEVLESVLFQVEEVEGVTPEENLPVLDVEKDTEIPTEETTDTVVEEEVDEALEQPEVKETEPVVEEKAPVVNESKIQAFSRSVPVEKKGTVYYYIKSGDNLNQIASSFSVSVNELLKWNNIDNANKIYVGQIISVNGTNDYQNYNKESKKFASSREFIDYVSAYAKTIAANYDLYASIMIAQASLETGYGTSDLGAKANNLFGIKADKDYEGYSIVMRTWEVKNGEKVYEDAYFRLYPSYYDSFIDYAEKLRNGKFMWDPTFYHGTWVENTNSFKDTTLFLTGRYATDPRYYFKLNSIILSNNLHQYDEKSYSDNSYDALITNSAYPIGNVPFDQVESNNYWHPNIKQVHHTRDLIGNFVQVSHVTRNGQYANIYLNGTELGWVDTRALTTINLNIKNVNYDAYFTSQNSNINSYPLGQAGTSVVGKTGDYLNQKIQVTSQTEDGLQSYVTLNGQGLGWVLSSDLGEAVTPYAAIVVNGSYNVDSLPWGSPGYKKIGTTSTYSGEELQVIAKSNNSAYLLVTLKGKNIGWVDTRAVKNFNYHTTNYSTYITSGGYEIDSIPWGEYGFKKLGRTSQYLGKQVQITKESHNKSYYYVKVDGKDIGWVDQRAFGFSQTPYEAVIVNGNFNVDTLPWGTPGYKKVGNTSNYLSEFVQVIGATQNGAYLLVTLNGKELGWIDSRAAKKYDSIAVDYESYIIDGKYQINNLPWGEPGYKKIGTSSEFLGQAVKVLRESKNQAYAYVTINGKPIGWVDVRALSSNITPYSAIVTEGKYEINTLPWGTPGYKRVGFTNTMLGKKVEIIASAKNGSYLLAKVENKVVGWIDSRSIVQRNVLVVNDSRKVTNGNYQINNVPWGVPGYRKIGMTASLLNQNVQVTLETADRSYAFVFKDGNPVGWIDIRSFN